MRVLKPICIPDICTTFFLFCFLKIRQGLMITELHLKCKCKAATLAKSTNASRSLLSSQWSWELSSEQVNFTTSVPAKLLKTWHGSKDH